MCRGDSEVLSIRHLRKALNVSRQKMTNTLVGDCTGLIHLIASILALITGTLVLTLRKGTGRHKQIGYIYLGSMILLLITAFMIYRLFNGFGIFHAFGLLSTFSLIMGMVPVLRRKPGNYIFRHFRSMYWSIIGLYGAFVAEIMVRVPSLNLFQNDIKPTAMFFNVVGLSISLVMIMALIYFKRQKPIWLKQFNQEKSDVS